MKETLLSCVCHGYHFVEILVDEDFGLTITHIERPRGFKQKLECIKNIIKGEDVFDGDLIVKQQDIKKIIKQLEIYGQNKQSKT